MFERIMNYFGYQKVKVVDVELPTEVRDMNPILKNVIERINSGENIITYNPKRVIIRVNDEYEIVHYSAGDSALRQISTRHLDWNFFSYEDQCMLDSFLATRIQNNEMIYRKEVYTSILGSKVLQ